MKDLANERQAVCQRLLDFNFEPVNAENWLPNGQQTWELIRDEIDTSDVALTPISGLAGAPRPMLLPAFSSLA